MENPEACTDHATFVMGYFNACEKHYIYRQQMSAVSNGSGICNYFDPIAISCLLITITNVILIVTATMIKKGKLKTILGKVT